MVPIRRPLLQRPAPLRYRYFLNVQSISRHASVADATAGVGDRVLASGSDITPWTLAPRLRGATLWLVVRSLVALTDWNYPTRAEPEELAAAAAPCR
jgi:hypothetical protein